MPAELQSGIFRWQRKSAKPCSPSPAAPAPETVLSLFGSAEISPAQLPKTSFRCLRWAGIFENPQRLWDSGVWKEFFGTTRRPPIRLQRPRLRRPGPGRGLLRLAFAAAHPLHNPLFYYRLSKFSSGIAASGSASHANSNPAQGRKSCLILTIESPIYFDFGICFLPNL